MNTWIDRIELFLASWRWWHVTGAALAVVPLLLPAWKAARRTWRLSTWPIRAWRARPKLTEEQKIASRRAKEERALAKHRARERAAFEKKRRSAPPDGDDVESPKCGYNAVTLDGIDPVTDGVRINWKVESIPGPPPSWTYTKLPEHLQIQPREIFPSRAPLPSTIAPLKPANRDRVCGAPGCHREGLPHLRRVEGDGRMRCPLHAGCDRTMKACREHGNEKRFGGVGGLDECRWVFGSKECTGRPREIHGISLHETQQAMAGLGITSQEAAGAFSRFGQALSEIPPICHRCGQGMERAMRQGTLGSKNVTEFWCCWACGVEVRRHRDSG